MSTHGITPAWAGKRAFFFLRMLLFWDHPRMGGEKWLLQIFVPEPFGITPAWAGKSFCDVSCNISIWDHPRVGGEKNIVRKASFDPQGSPPRRRGKVGPVIQLRAGAGITPAWAGKRSGRAAVSKTAGDHPRVGGEKRLKTPSARFTSGSPPRGRGKVSGQVSIPGIGGITPA